MDIKSENTSDINKKSENPETFMSRFSVVTYIHDKPTSQQIDDMTNKMFSMTNQKNDSQNKVDMDDINNLDDKKIPNIEIKNHQVIETQINNSTKFAEYNSCNTKEKTDALINEELIMDDGFEMDTVSYEKLGIIYMGTSPSGKKYIGQHNSPHFKSRLRSHLSGFRKFLVNIENQNNPESSTTQNYFWKSSGCPALYNAFAKYSPKSFEWEILESNIPFDKLSEKEDQYIIKYNTMAPNGYNLKLNDSYTNHKMYSQETLDKMSKSQIISRTEHLEKYRENKEQLAGLPMYVTYFTYKGKHGYRLVNHPNCKHKQFIDKLTVPVEELKQKMINFIAIIKVTPYRTSRQRKAESTDVPEGMVEQKPGRFMVQLIFKKIRHRKFFSQEPRSEALKLAIEWLENKKKEIGWVKKVRKPRKKVTKKLKENTVKNPEN